MIVLPTGPLEEDSLGLRVGSAVLAVNVFYLFRKHVLLSIFSGIGLLSMGI